MSARSLALAAMLLVLPGCDDPPTCSVDVELSGGLAATVDWDLSGEQSCGFADGSALVSMGDALVFIDSGGETGFAQFIVAVEGGIPGPGQFVSQVLLVTAEDIWDSGSANCTVIITDYVREDWSRTDFIEIAGIVDCPANIPSVAGGGPLTMSTLGFNGHLLDTDLSFENL